MSLDLARLTYKTINELGEVVEMDMATDQPIEVVAKHAMDIEVAAKYRLSPAVVEIICRLIREGKTYKQIIKMPGMPPASILYKWKRESEDLRIGLQEAEKDRADIFHGKIVEMVEAGLHTLDKADVPGFKLQVETLKYLAEVDNPDKYKAKSKDNEGGGAVTIQVNTGIQRDPEPVVEAQYTEVKNEEGSISGQAQEVSREEPAGTEGA